MTCHTLQENDDFENLVKNSDNLYVIVDFYASWCKPCKELEPKFTKASSKYDEITFMKVDAEEFDGLAEKYQVNSLPTVLVFASKNCDLEERLVGNECMNIDNICMKYE